MMAGALLDTAVTTDIGYLNLLAAQEAANTLMRGFTSVRDMGYPRLGSNEPLTRA